MTDVVTPVFADDERRADLVRGPVPPHVDLNGIDFVEVDPSDHTILRVSFLKPIPAGAYGVVADPTLAHVGGGTRIVGIKATGATIESASVLRIDVTRGGDFSPYVLSLPDYPGLDPVRRRTVFSFMASCPTGIDCRPAPCPPVELVEPRLDYLAKDYASFRQMLVDLLPTLNPDWTERNPSDLGMALLELLAYTGDHLSYYQDAVANEAYLDTVRTRISARRHAKLIDYRMHDGRNAWAAVHVTVNGTGTLPRGTPLFTKIQQPLPGQATPPDRLIPPGALNVDLLQQSPAYRDVVALETAYTQTFRRQNNEIRIHTWGEEECCLPIGTTGAWLYSDNGGTAVRPVLADGDYVILEERVGPRTGAVPDADPAHRRLVRIEGAPEQTEDPLYAAALVAGVPVVRNVGDPALPLLRITWRRADALDFPVCLSARLRDGTLVREVSVVRGNIVLADHGLTTEETQTPDELSVDGRMQLSRAPLTQEIRALDAPIDATTGRFAVDRRDLTGDVRSVLPAVTLQVTTPIDVEEWRSMPDLLDSGPLDEHFVAEIDDEGRAILRFGDGEYGRRLPDTTALRAVYRIGNGRSGNVGRDTIAHAAPVVPSTWITSLRNPIAATAGVDAETIEEVRQLAPQAFHTELFRAVTEDDWAAAAKRLAGVQGAAASYRWTGSWTTIFVAVDPVNRVDLVDLPNGNTRLEPLFEAQVRAFLTRFRLAGYDIELRPPRFVPVTLELDVCARHGYFRSDVAAAVRDALSNRVLPDGTRGFFHPSNFTFGDPLYLSRLYAAVERVEGVESVAIRNLVRYGQPDAGELARGALRTGRWEIVRLDNDPSFVEHGVLTVTARGGKA
jgi:hypothetical protein